MDIVVVNCIYEVTLYVQHVQLYFINTMYNYNYNVRNYMFTLELVTLSFCDENVHILNR